MSSLPDLVASRDLFINLTLRELRGKYKRSTLGWAWSMLNPLATMLLFTVIFSFVFGIDAPVGHPSGLHFFALFLLCGLLPWNFVSNGLNGGMECLIANTNLIRKVYFPREVLVASTTASWLISFLIEFGVLSVALLLFGNMVLPWLPVVLLLVALQTGFVLGLAMLLSVLNVYFRDVRHLMGIVLQVWFYATPIVYPVSLITKADAKTSLPLVTLFHINPMVGFVEAYRDVMYDLRWPSLGNVAYLVAATTLSLLIGYLAFQHWEPRLAEEL
jgi:ABC-2 type transport system permease protein